MKQRENKEIIVPAKAASRRPGAFVIPAKAGIQALNMILRTGLRPGPRLSPGRRLLLFAGMTILCFAAVPSWALSVTPSIQTFELKPGERVEGEIVLANTEEETVHVSPTTKSWFVLPANRKIPIEEWLKVDGEEFSFNQGESRTIKFWVRAPKKAEGELVGMISFRTKTATRTGVEFVMSSAVYLAIKGTEKLSGDIRAIMVTPSTDSVTAGVVVRNTGNVHLRPVGLLRILTSDGSPIANVELQRGQPTYPGNQRPYIGTVKDLSMPPGKYTAEIDLMDFDRQVLIDKTRQKFILTEDRKVQF